MSLQMEITMSADARLLPGRYYHIYHRGNNREVIFREDRNYRYFLKRYAAYIEPVAFTYAYCLLPNHFHVAVRIKTDEEQFLWRLRQTSEVSQTSEVFEPWDPSWQFGKLFNSYTRAFNRAYQRSGSLFEGRFKRKEVTSLPHFLNLIAYIHNNPVHHNLVEELRDWPYSSWHALQTDAPTYLQRDELRFWTGGFRSVEAYAAAHPVDISAWVADDWD